MNRERRSRKRSSTTNGAWKASSGNEHSGRTERNGRRGGGKSSARQLSRSPHAVTQEQIRADEEAILAFKSENKPICERCGLPIADLATALEDRRSGKAVHFDCTVAQIAEKETVAEGERIIYIGQGRFGILHFANPHDMRHFTIKKIIEWEDKDKRSVWRDQMASLYSRVK